MSAFRYVFIVSLLSLNLLAADSPKAAESKPAGPDDNLTLFEDADAGYSLRVPEGFVKLSQDESREVFRGISEHFGKQAGERALRRPPAWFRGPAEGGSVKLLPPSLAIGYTELAGQIDPSQMQRYKTELEEEMRKRGDDFGEIKVSLIDVGGINSLRIEHDVVSPLDRVRNRIVNVAVPGNGRRYDIVMNFSPEQAEKVEAALATVVRTFKVKNPPIMDAAAQSRWSRVLLWTLGGFAAGVLLSFLLKVLSGVGEKVPEKENA
ncbi:MAG TPA: hypothetical protein VEK08_13455 [Planctomycetota bacterium]|nr:hypothetical protein [Planctomycetota bacterium]